MIYIVYFSKNSICTEDFVQNRLYRLTRRVCIGLCFEWVQTRTNTDTSVQTILYKSSIRVESLFFEPSPQCSLTVVTIVTNLGWGLDFVGAGFFTETLFTVAVEVELE